MWGPEDCVLTKFALDFRLKVAPLNIRNLMMAISEKRFRHSTPKLLDNAAIPKWEYQLSGALLSAASEQIARDLMSSDVLQQIRHTADDLAKLFTINYDRRHQGSKRFTRTSLS